MQGKGVEDMDREKFQQKALKQTEQKKSKSAEFLMVKEDEAASEGIENPAFNSSSMDLSAYQTSEGQVIGRDRLSGTLEAHQQNLSLPAPTESRGNEYSRNYFDPLMDEEINPRQSGMEVSGEVLMEVNERILYDELIKLLAEETKREDAQAKDKEDKVLDSEWPVNPSKSDDLNMEDEDETIPSYVEQFEKSVREAIVLLGSSSLEQIPDPTSQVQSSIAQNIIEEDG
ncbi:orofacial cleft 1 candidate gene 1 protein homolog [Ornithorhynchus anatinus]|uniref:orofacial cleft 1 candidate gene 1 protein homolog n=1 Tax=Ornithorhynchus anatinus TaxID=9258 RepID=UPI0019D47CB0|nr:orofacial cleft 1 candidate gene 1 protein homolog [Ornithorhynchus anatinus]